MKIESRSLIQPLETLPVNLIETHHFTLKVQVDVNYNITRHAKHISSVGEQKLGLLHWA